MQRYWPTKACIVILLSIPMLSAQERLTADQTAKALESCPVTAQPEVLYSTFNNFCITHFGAEREPLIYDFFGKQQSFIGTGAWLYASEDSAVIGCESSLPAISTVEYGEGKALDKKTGPTDRPYYIHVHTLRNLQPGTTYTYRISLRDEKSALIFSDVATFTTKVRRSGVSFPAEGSTPPYKLDIPGTTYVLSKDLITPGMAIQVIGDNITLDLNGHTVRFGEGATTEVDCGIACIGTETTKIKYVPTGFKIYNGTLEQGASKALNDNTNSKRFCPITMKGADIEAAGLHITYHGPQTWGMTVDHPSGAMHIHHNIFTDKGGIITDRHGSGTRSLGFTNKADGENAFVFSHNLIRRTRQNGMGGANTMSHNEIYLDSCSTNSFAIQPNSAPGVKAGDCHHNRIFGTGFNAYGFGWAHESLRVHDNLIHFHGIMANDRWAATESWGDLSMLEGMRVTNYGKGGQVRNDLEYRHNLIVLRGGNGCELRGTGFFSDTSITDIVFHDNTVKVISEDEKTTQVACLSAQGHTEKTGALPVTYRNNTLISNVCHIRLGDSYGRGHNHTFIGNTLIREGQRADFHAVAIGGGFTTSGHRLIDCIIGEGISLADPFWQKTSSKSWYAVQWTLTVQAAAGAHVVIHDASGALEFDGVVPADGKLSIPLTQCVVHPATWPAGGEALGLNGGSIEPKTPHRVAATINGVEHIQNVTIDKLQLIRF